jgi:ribosomal protein L28
MNSIPIVRHLDDIDDLRTYWRDGPLISWQREKAHEIAEIILNKYNLSNSKKLIFPVSTKRRWFQTANLVKESLLSLSPELDIRIIKQLNLREIDQGEFILPHWYEAWMECEWLRIAAKIFFWEVFWWDHWWKDNYYYKYWDPLLLKDGSYKYDILQKYFNKSWESYADVLIRVYTQVLKTIKNNKALDKLLVKSVIFTHWQPSQIFKDLFEVAQLVVNENMDYKVWQLPRICWDRYKKRGDKKRDLGKVDVISLKYINNPKVLGLLSDEINFLKNWLPIQ